MAGIPLNFHVRPLPYWIDPKEENGRIRKTALPATASNGTNPSSLERLSKLLQPEIRDPALAETFWELAGADLAHDTSELALVGQILDDARVVLGEQSVEMELFVAR